MDKPWVDVRINAGRRPTPIGGDGIPPWIRIYDWQAQLLSGWLDDRGISHEVRLDGGREVPGHGNMSMTRVSFPGGDPVALQRMLDAWQEESR